MRLVRALGAGVLAAALLCGTAACGGAENDAGGAGGSERQLGGEDVTDLARNPGEGEGAVLDDALDPEGEGAEAGPLSASEVAAGLRVVKDLANSATAALGPNDLELVVEDAATLQADIAPSWALVSVTVRERDPGTATAIEEAFPAFGAAIGAKDQAAARAAADRIVAAVDAYIAKFPPEGDPAQMPGEDPGADGGDGTMPGFAPSAPPPPSEAPAS